MSGWGLWLLMAVACAVIAAVPVLLQARLRKHHPEVYRRLVTTVVEDMVQTTRFRHGALWRFLSRREHKALNDPALSALSDGMLIGVALLLIVVVGGLVALFAVTAFRIA